MLEHIGETAIVRALAAGAEQIAVAANFGA
jgi:hypothetical protein